MTGDRTHRVPDGREISAIYEGHMVGWTVWFTGEEERPVTALDIHDALEDIFDLVGVERWPDWFMQAAAALAARDTGQGVAYLCPCCDAPTLGEPPPGTYEICATCGWEDDLVQFKNLDFRGGANTESLREARQYFAQHGSHSSPAWPHPRTRSELPRADETG